MRLNFIRQRSAALVLIATFAYIFLRILSYQNCWVQPEMLSMEGRHLAKNLMTLSLDWWKEIFDFPLWEGAPRIYRPLSSLLQMINDDFRVWLWQFMAPHPSLSLTWIFTLGLSPYLLYRLLRSLRLSTHGSMLCCAVFIANTGILSLAVMYFRPSKTMTNFSILLCLNLAAFAVKKKDFKTYGLLLLAMQFSFFWDETALLIYPAVIVFFPRLVFKDVRNVLAFALLPLVTVFFYLFVLTKLTVAAGFPRIDLLAFEPARNAIGPQDQSLFSDILTNFRLALADCFGFINPALPLAWTARAFESLVGVGALGFLIAAACQAWKGRASGVGVKARLLVFLFFLVVFDSYALATIRNNTWGLYWYGVYIPVFFVLWFGLTFRDLEADWKASKTWLTALCAIMIGSSLYVFPATNFVYKFAHYYVEPSEERRLLLALFLNEENRFAIQAKSALPDLYETSRDYWRCKRQGGKCAEPRLPELKYLAIELHDF